MLVKAILLGAKSAHNGCCCCPSIHAAGCHAHTTSLVLLLPTCRRPARVGSAQGEQGGRHAASGQQGCGRLWRRQGRREGGCGGHLVQGDKAAGAYLPPPLMHMLPCRERSTLAARVAARLALPQPGAVLLPCCCCHTARAARGGVQIGAHPAVGQPGRLLCFCCHRHYRYPVHLPARCVCWLVQPACQHKRGHILACLVAHLQVGGACAQQMRALPTTC